MKKAEVLAIITKIQQVDLAELKLKVEQDQDYDTKPIIEKLELIGTRPTDR